MAEESSFFNGIEYGAEEFATYFKEILTTGIFHKNNIPSLKVQKGEGLQTILEPGVAFLEGYRYRNTEDIIFTHEADETNMRIDRIVVRLNLDESVQRVRSFILKGTPATNPQPPQLQRDDMVYEISLAQIEINAGATTINSVTDERYDSSVAGLVSSLITIPTDDFKEQWEEWFLGIQNQIGARLLYGQDEPDEVIAGDVWLRNL